MHEFRPLAGVEVRALLASWRPAGVRLPEALLTALVEVTTTDPDATPEERLRAIEIIGRTQGTRPFCRLLRSC